ncbi:hypothetical protein CsatB_021985 [Cannabis sativa]
MAAIIPLFVIFILTHSLLPSSAEEEGTLSKCGVFSVSCSEDGPKIQLKKEEEGPGHWYRIDSVQSGPDSLISIVVKEEATLSSQEEPCEYINEYSFPTTDNDSWYNFKADNSHTLYRCSHDPGLSTIKGFSQTKCHDHDFYCGPPNMSFPFQYQQTCQNFTLPFPPPPPPPFPSPPPPVNIHFSFGLRATPACFGCYKEGGYCSNTPQENQFQCTSKGKKKRKLIIGIIAGLSSGVLLTTIVLGIIMWRRKHKPATSRNIPDPYLNVDDPEGASGHLGVLVFSYKDLTEATNNFDAEKELGDGGFGAVYHGVLKDGREVAVKRLYEHNYKRVEQFVNEIKILTLLRHKNLVSLYGCTSHRSRELLLVYEYIPNGTVADHLHGDQAITSPLTWSIRLSIAIETASALAYLHASDIVHRDVKTNNILLDNNFSVKVADFGLSRLFPNDVTHVSTAPQGTPGYVDPEYHQCYQLTSKSDVYSFGVVLVELLSSMPAVDITRHRHEINLSNLAISKIQKRAYNELIDQQLGFASDIEVRTMTIAVAELAFECLQQDKEMRPTMDEVLERLRRIEDGKIETQPPPPQPSPECGDEVGLLKNMKHDQHSPSSPNAVTEAWPSTTSTTPNFSA